MFHGFVEVFPETGQHFNDLVNLVPQGEGGQRFPKTGKRRQVKLLPGSHQCF